MKERLSFAKVVQAYDILARSFLRQLAIKLHLPLTAFDSLLQAEQSAAATSSLEAIQNLGAADQPSPVVSGCEAHVDKGLLTCIFADSSQGLQVMWHAQKLFYVVPAVQYWHQNSAAHILVTHSSLLSSRPLMQGRSCSENNVAGVQSLHSDCIGTSKKGYFDVRATHLGTRAAVA